MKYIFLILVKYNPYNRFEKKNEIVFSNQNKKVEV
jgi:hypothetical protein